MIHYKNPSRKRSEPEKRWCSRVLLKKDKHHMLTIFITSSWQQGQVIFLVETKVRQMKRASKEREINFDQKRQII